MSFGAGAVKMVAMRRAFALFLLGAVLGAILTAAPAAATTVHHDALIYGDSVMYEARTPILQRFAATHPTWGVQVRAFPGIAVCDMLGLLTADIAADHPTVVVFQAVGDSFTPCMQDANGVQLRVGSPEWAAKYQADLSAAFAQATAAGAHVVFMVGLPQLFPLATRAEGLLAAAALAAAAPFLNVTISKAATTAFGGLHYHQTLGCVRGTFAETAAMGCVSGRIAVHSPTDSVHFCPTGYANGAAFYLGCPEYSSGAFRFSRAIVTTAVRF